MKFRIWPLGFILVLALLGCGGSSSGTSASDPASGSNWDEMNWDEGRWG